MLIQLDFDSTHLIIAQAFVLWLMLTPWKHRMHLEQTINLANFFARSCAIYQNKSNLKATLFCLSPSHAPCAIIATCLALAMVCYETLKTHPHHYNVY